MQQKRFGFTLVEVLVVIAIISLLSSVALTSLSGVRKQAREVRSASDLNNVRTVTTEYSIDTGQFPPTCRVQYSCNASTDPLLNKRGVSGWDGPYGSIHDRTHGFGGHIGFERTDADGDGSEEFFIVLDDDPPNALNNAGRIPQSALEKIDERVDGGDGLNQGKFQTGIFGVSTGPGSGVYIQKE